MWEKRFGRIFSILSHLSPYSQVTVHDLAAEYEVDPKTIQRDLRVLENAQLGVFFDNDKIKISRVGYRRIQSWIMS